MPANAIQRPIPQADFGYLREDEIDALIELGRLFFNESEYTAYTEYHPDAFRQVLTLCANNPDISPCIVARVDGVPVGFIHWQHATLYTKDPLALLGLTYVHPDYRRGPMGRLLYDIAEEIAKAAGCCAFYSGVMSRMSTKGTGHPLQEKMMCNMHLKRGYEPLAGWFVKVLKGEADE